MTHPAPFPPQWQPPQHALPVPRRRRRWPWVFGGVVALAVVIGTVGGGEEKSATTGAAAPASPAQPAATPGQPVAAGQTVDSDDLQITAGPLRKVKPQYGERQLCSKVTYRNTGDGEEFFNAIDWKIQSPDGVQESAWLTADDNALHSGQLAPGGTVSGDVCRKDPGLKGEYVVIHDGMFQDPIRWKSTLS